MTTSGGLETCGVRRQTAAGDVVLQPDSGGPTSYSNLLGKDDSPVVFVV